MSKCKACKADVQWVETYGGTRIPINYEKSNEKLFKAGGTVIFDPSIMQAHSTTCPFFSDALPQEKKVKRLIKYSARAK